MIRAILLVFGLFFAVPAFAQFDPILGDTHHLYSCHWNGSITSGTVYSIAISDATSANYLTYPLAVQVKVTAATMVHIRTRATTAPTSTVQLPTWIAAVYNPHARCYTSSNVGTGELVTSYPMAAGESQTFSLEGMRFPRGVATRRNVSVHIDSASGATGYVTWKFAQKATP